MAEAGMGQIMVRGEGQTTCIHHRRNVLDWFCETCSELVCSDCVSTSHRGHDNILLSKITPSKKRIINAFINETEKNEIIQIQEEINSTEENIKQRSSHSAKVATDVKRRGEKLKADIDILTDRTLSQLKLLEEGNYRLLNNYKTELEKKLNELKEKVRQCKESLQTATDVQVYELVRRLRTKIALPGKPGLGSAEFTPNSISVEILEIAFGKLTFVQSSQWAIVGSPVQQQALLPQTTVLSEWKAPCYITSICPTSGGGAWTSERYRRAVTHLTSQGEVQQQIQCPVQIADIGLSPTTHNLWICSHENNSVMELTSGQLATRFNTNDEPLCLCVTRDDRIFVGTNNRITEYTSRGKPGISTKSLLFWKLLVRSPWKISQCPVSENVAVVDKDWKYSGGKDEPLVVVMDKKLQEVYRYGRPQHVGEPDSLPFDPSDVTYDSLGNLVIADHQNSCLLLLSGDGAYLRLLHTGPGSACAVSVDKDRILWASFVQQIRLLQYTAM